MELELCEQLEVTLRFCFAPIWSFLYFCEQRFARMISLLVQSRNELCSLCVSFEAVDFVQRSVHVGCDNLQRDES